MKYTFVSSLFAALATAEMGDIFIGCYTDPNHPDGYRVITFTQNYNWGYRVGSCDGSDTGKVQEYSLPAASREDETIEIDFSSKGGPSDLIGTWNHDATGIEWSDGNIWPMVGDDWCIDTEPSTFLV